MLLLLGVVQRQEEYISTLLTTLLKILNFTPLIIPNYIQMYVHYMEYGYITFLPSSPLNGNSFFKAFPGSCGTTI